MANLVSQEAVEAVYATTATQARVSQEAVEVLATKPLGVRVSQDAVEAVYSTTVTKVLVSQAALEVLYRHDTTTTAAVVSCSGPLAVSAVSCGTLTATAVTSGTLTADPITC